MSKNKPTPSGGGDLMAKISQMQAEMQRVQNELAEERLTITVGGDAVTVVVDGQQRLHHIIISPEALTTGQADKGMLEDLLLTAVNTALEQSQTLAADRLRGLSAGLGMPGF